LPVLCLSILGIAALDRRIEVSIHLTTI
jgi:hypothetical protein